MIRTVYQFMCDKCGHCIYETQEVVGSQPFIYAVKVWDWRIEPNGELVCKACDIKRKEKETRRNENNLC